MHIVATKVAVSKHKHMATGAGSGSESFLSNLAVPGIIQVEQVAASDDNVLNNWAFIILVSFIVIMARFCWRLKGVFGKYKLQQISTQVLCFSFSLFVIGLVSLLVPVGISALLILRIYGSLYVVSGYAVALTLYFAITLGVVFAYYSTYMAYGEHWGRTGSNAFLRTLRYTTYQRVERLLEVPE